MHGQNRAAYKARLTNPETAAGLAKKATQWNALFAELMNRHSTHTKIQNQSNLTENTTLPNLSSDRKASLTPIDDNHKQSLELNAKLLLVNPDPLYLWNIRRELLILNKFSFFQIESELELIANSLRRNPKAYGAWFHRKWTIQKWITILKASSNISDSNSENIESDNISIIQNKEHQKLLETELNLCKDFLELDERNFHCWNYRRFVVSAIGVVSALDANYSWGVNDEGKENESSKRLHIDGSWDWLDFDEIVMGSQIAGSTIETHLFSNNDNGNGNGNGNGNDNKTSYFLSQEYAKKIVLTEWDYTTAKIESNFSNYSAFHYRSKLIPLYLQVQIHSNNKESHLLDHYHIILDLAKEELQLLQQAMFTEPDDQTAWWYHRFIISSFMNLPSNVLTYNDGGDNELLEMYMSILEEELESIEELIETEDGNCKWGLLAKHMILDKLIDIDENIINEEMMEDWSTKRNKCLNALIEIDPDRQKRYECMKM